METVINEHNELIAVRVPPGDRWKLVSDPKKQVHPTLTETLEAFFHKTGFKGEYRLAPLSSELYAISTKQIELEEPKQKTYSIYGEY